MRIGKTISIMFLFLLVTSFVFAEIDHETRIYFDAQNQKILSQLSTKMDTSVNAVSNDMKKEFISSTNYLEEEIRKEYKQSIIALVFAIMGANLVILSIFKIVDMKLNRTRIIEKYEKQLEKQIEDNNKYRLELDLYRASLLKFLEDVEKKNKIEQPQLEQNLKPKKKFWDIWKILGVILILIGVIGLIIVWFFYFKK